MRGHAIYQFTTVQVRLCYRSGPKIVLWSIFNGPLIDDDLSRLWSSCHVLHLEQGPPVLVHDARLPPDGPTPVLVHQAGLHRGPGLGGLLQRKRMSLSHGQELSQ